MTTLLFLKLVKLDVLIKHSNRTRARLKAVRLQSYWKKVCEDEKRSQRRNEQLLRDVERLETHAAEMHERTEKLRGLKVTTNLTS